MPALPLGLRNRLAELIVDAFDSADARVTLAALAAWCREPELGREALEPLRTLDWFETRAPGRLALRGVYREHRDTLCGRVQAAVRSVGVGSGGEACTLAGLLARAARLARAGLYFEVHELLEPAWLRAQGDPRLALQGLIQVAVALHHATSGNRPGAISLLAEGLAKLEAGRPALPLDTAAWARDLGRVLAAWRDGAPAPPVPPWPAPTEAAWHSS